MKKEYLNKGIYESEDIERLARKIERLMDLNGGENYLKTLYERTKIKDEMISLFKFPSGLIEFYLDQAIASFS